jgi:dolichol-phosphate mannosyltransferase
MPELSVVVPTFAEAENISQLHRLLQQTLADFDWELIVVDDDSPDGTAEVVRALAQQDQRVRCIQRIGRRGLSSAVLEGALSSSAPLVAVMDGDLQHDERILPRMIQALREQDLDLVVGSRHTDEGSTGQWDARRERISKVATRLARGLVPSELRDPMSGFFVVRTALVRESARALSGRGYKILLDLFASSPRPLRFLEVPYTFRTRTHGESKLDALVVWQYLMLLADKRIGHIVSPRLLSFGLVGAVGVGVQFAVLTPLYVGLGIKFQIADTAAICAAMTFNFFCNNLLTYRDRRLRGLAWVRGLLRFYAVCSLGALANIGVASYVYLPKTWALSALAGIVVGTLWNYLASAHFTWGAASEQ